MQSPKLEICAAHDNFVAATYTPDTTASVTALGLSACDAVANLRVFLQPFGYELPNVEVYASGGALTGNTRLQPVGLIEEEEDGSALGPISECESAVDRVFKQHLSTGRN